MFFENPSDLAAYQLRIDLKKRAQELSDSYRQDRVIEIANEATDAEVARTDALLNSGREEGVDEVYLRYSARRDLSDFEVIPDLARTAKPSQLRQLAPTGASLDLERLVKQRLGELSSQSDWTRGQKEVEIVWLERLPAADLDQVVKVEDGEFPREVVVIRKFADDFDFYVLGPST